MSESDVSRAVTLIEVGVSQRDVGRRLGVSQSVISRLWNQHQELGTLRRRPGQGRSRSTTHIEDRFLRVNELRNRFLTARELQNDLSQATGNRVSDQTVRNRLLEAGLRSKRPVRVPRLTARHKRARLQFARDHRRWQLRQWRKVMFSDESKFTIFGNDGRARVWRRGNERFINCCLATRVPFSGGSVLVWDGITIDGRTDLVIIRNGTLTAQRYVDEVLDVHIRPRAEQAGQIFLFMQDGARPHAARLVREYLGEHNIPLLECPACSPDLNPIEHVWDQLGRSIRGRPNQSRTLDELEIALREEWEWLPQDSLRRLIRTMPQRVRAVISARGGNTRY
ncbi:MAG: transposase [Candidatus Baumannia cicadellinicola]|nr:transposase [Candidatus Baumannia cicadellinicola]